MTDLPDDEVVSAVLDGEATDEEVARVRADAGLTARLDELRAARDAIAAPVTGPSPADRDAAIAAAMAEAATPVRSVVDLRDRRRRRALQVASIAAALLIVVGIVGAIAARSRNDSGTATSAAGTGTSIASEDTAQPAAGGSAKGSFLSDLGSFSAPEDVVNAVRSEKTAAASPAAPAASQRSNAATTEAADAAASCPTRPDATSVRRAQLSGQPVVVVVFGDPGQQSLDILDSNCTVVFTSPL